MEVPDKPALGGWQRDRPGQGLCVWFFQVRRGGSGVCVNQEEDADGGRKTLMEGGGAGAAWERGLLLGWTRRRGGDAVPIPSTVAFPESKDSVTTVFFCGEEGRRVSMSWLTSIPSVT